ncbi:hypothetical protein [Streptomyces violarus]|uniref:hypothetical protein n=1 Tax=Streptomyces violarus TaxID=67380 RepID=UPI0021BFA384|nr:hypothetical protein [Streptomyces violarus]MCT9139191.1 hypothetical protein [Streptomyces violarus]
MAREGNQSTEGIGGARIGGALDVLRRHRRALYCFTFLVSLLTVVLGCAILAGGFAAAWDAFENVREYADRNIANEDSYVAYADGGLPPLVRVGAVVTVLLLVLGLLVVSVLHTAYAVGDSHATRDGGPLSIRELWRRTRRRFPAALAVNALTGLAVGAVELAALVMWNLVESGEVPGVEPTPLGETASPQYTLVGWVLPIAVGCLGPLLYSRLAVATAETVLERRAPFVALYRSWVLTRPARWRALGVGALVTAVPVLVFWAARYAAAPLAHFAGLGMLWLSDDNVWITGVLVLILPTAVALLLLPPLVMPLVCAVFARLHGELRAREETVQSRSDMSSTKR